MNTTPPDTCASWSRLSAHAETWRGTHLSDLFDGDPKRASALIAEAPGIRLDFSRQPVTALTLRLLTQLARERGFDEWREALLEGKPVNTTEHRAAGHTALRAGDNAPHEVRKALARMRELAEGLRGGPIRLVVNLGIGGSDLGPRLVADALPSVDGAPVVRFVANIDPMDLSRALAGADPDSTLFVVASKTFTTQETLANAVNARHWLGARPLAQHMVAVTASASAAREFGITEVLPLPQWVGGRYSLWSSVGFAAMCAIGPDAFDQLLCGAADTDRHFAAAPPEANLPLLMALLGVWNINFLGTRAHAVLPYSHALRLLPAWLQQLDMESNGKGVDHDGRALTYQSGPVIFGAEGTVGQHSFHQLLQQGTQVVPSDFIVFDKLPGDPAATEVLAAHAKAQAEALAHGTKDPGLEPWRRHPGNRPSNTLHVDQLDARHLGRLLALYEHKVFAQGVVWNVNSFDQWGVELGKQLARGFLRS